jgi:hypothetical protein
MIKAQIGNISYGLVKQNEKVLKGGIYYGNIE